ncbi:MAG: hypothetical protein ACYDGM_01420 [Vulcanimicrobiaceae bacterium]
MRVGQAILELARATGAPALFFVGVGKNVGKTVAMRAVYEATAREGLRVGLASIGRDGEAIDIGDGQPKPRLFLRAGSVVATARDVLPRSPASEIVELSSLATAAGALVYARVMQGAYYELVGPPTASGVRAVVAGLLRHASYALIDGAVDRVAALAGGEDAIVVAVGAGAAATVEEAVAQVRGLVCRLRIPRFDPQAAQVRIEGALTPGMAAGLIAQHERREIVLRDPTRLAMAGPAALHALDRLNVRCEHPLRVVAVTVASSGRERSFEPQAFASAVAAATGVPVFDVYAGSVAA